MVEPGLDLRVPDAQPGVMGGTFLEHAGSWETQLDTQA